jgi:creatinine amidohydrolase
MRDHIGDGNFGGFYQRSDDEMLALWTVAIEETRSLLAEGWD